MRQDREPTGFLDRQVETSNTSPNGTGALSVAGTEAITRSVAPLKTLNQKIIDGIASTNPGADRGAVAAKWTGRGLLAADVGFGVYAVVEAPEGEKVRSAARETGSVAGGWAGAAYGATTGATIGAAVGSFIPGAGTVVGGAVGGVVGGVVGGFAGSRLGRKTGDVLGGLF